MAAVGAAALVLSLAAPVRAEIPVTVTVPERTAPGVVEPEPDDGTTLPRTGGDIGRFLGIALVLVLSGSVLLVVKRRREGASGCND